MDVERTFRQVRKPQDFPRKEPGESVVERRFPFATDDIDSFPPEDSPYARALILDDIDALDRARADEGVADAPILRVLALPKPRERRAADMALPLLAVLAVAGWGAFLWERMQPTSLPDVVQAAPTAAVTASSNVLTEQLLPARALAAFAPLAADRRAPAPSAPAVVAATTNISGSWTLTRAVESSSYNAFTGMTFGYEVRLQQRGGRITGSGTRVSENGRDLAKGSQVPVRLQGTIAGDKLTLNFTEGTGSRRRSGRFLLVVEEPGLLRGRFSSNAASSKGTAEAQRPTG
jgi:hypothetical protein